MSRNGSGTYTLPSGNPVVSGTLIEASWANTTLSDIATALTDSLSRSGQGGMTAALRLFDGTNTVPGLAWGSETTTGWYRAGAGDMRLVITGSQVIQYLSTGVAITGTLSASGNATVGGTLAVTGAMTLTANPTLSAGTANGVLYLNGSKVATSGSTLNTDGTNLALGGSATAFGSGVSTLLLKGTGATTTKVGALYFKDAAAVDAGAVFLQDDSTYGFTSWNSMATGNFFRWAIGALGSEQMRLTSTGLGIGTSSPGAKLDVVNASGRAARIGGFQFSGTTSSTDGGNNLLGSGVYWNGSNLTATQTSGAVVQLGNGVIQLQTLSGLTAGNTYSFAPQVTLDSSGNLGLGVTPSAWVSGDTILQVKAGSGSGAIWGRTNSIRLMANGYYDGTNFKFNTTGVKPTLLNLANDGSFQFYTFDSGTAGGNATATQAMTLDASGNLGVGVTSPAFRLDVDSTAGTVVSLNSTNASGPGLRFTRSGTANGYVGSAKYIVGGALADFGIDVSGANNLIFGTNDVERARIDSSGNLLVGTTSTGESHSIVGKVVNAWALQLLSNFATASQNYGLTVRYVNAAPNNTTNEFFMAQDTGGQRFTVRSNGGLANYQANNVNLSDRLEKTNFAPAGEYLSKICAIPVQTFNYIDQNLEEDPGPTLGVVAQDVQAVAPELVMESNWGTEEEPKQRLSIYQTDLQYALMKCIQEQQAIIEQLKARLDAANL